MTETSPAADASFKIYHSTFQSILGPFPSIGLLRTDTDGLATFHEACIYHAASKSVFVTSNQLPLSDEQTSNSTSNKRVIITRIYDHEDLSQTSTVDATPPDLIMANGGVNYKSGLLFCAQGNKSNTRPSALVFMADPETPHQTSSLISSFYGRPFNSINDVIVHPQDESIWFTDPCYGYHQGIRPEPELPSHVYRFDPKEGSIRAMADDFVRPNGLCFSPDLKLLYVTDTGAIHGAQTVAFDKAGKSSIYAFDILESKHGKLQVHLFLPWGSWTHFCHSRTIPRQPTLVCVCRIRLPRRHQMRYGRERL
jgi:gluconolactonase